MAQIVALVCPVRSHGPPNCSIFRWCVGVHVAGIRKLGSGCTLDLVDLAVRKTLQIRQTELLCQCVDSGVSKNVLLTLVCLGDTGCLELRNSIVANILELQEVSKRVDVLIWDIDSSLFITID